MGWTDVYRIALLSDVHGNEAALRAVLEDLARAPCDEVVVAGDLVLFGPRPAGALELLRSLDARFVLGNTDRDVVRSSGEDPGLVWVAERIGAEGLAFLAELPLEVRVTPPGGDLLVVHATPTDVDGLLVTEPNPLTPWPVTTEAEAARLLGSAQADLVVHGHIHYASSGVRAGRRIASIGSVGFPFDGDPRAAWAVGAWDGRDWRLEHRRVSYDHEAVAAELERSGAPFAETAAARIREARPVPFPTWVVFRQDDHGNRFEVGRTSSEAEAARQVEAFEARGHKQTYWYQRERR